jgi:hypothetical protein
VGLRPQAQVAVCVCPAAGFHCYSQWNVVM